MKNINSGDIKTLESLIHAAGQITITTHMKPDGDAMGSSAAMYHFLKQLGKSPKVVVNDPWPQYLSFLISDETAKDIHVFENEPEKADETIKGSDLIICLDYNAFHRTDRLESPLTEAEGKKVLIDHHLNPSTKDFDLCFSETEISSASELLYHILCATSSACGKIENLGLDCCTSLMTGMTTDTNNFANSVFPSTLHMASDLLAAGVDRDMILDRLYNQYKENRLRLMGHVMKDLMTITGDGVAYIVLDRQTQEKYEVAEGDTEGFVNMPLAIAGVRMSILAKEDGDRFRISIRSKKGTSANMCARKFFNGGGHENAAGGRLNIGLETSDAEDTGRYIETKTHLFFNDEEDN